MFYHHLKLPILRDSILDRWATDASIHAAFMKGPKQNHKATLSEMIVGCSRWLECMGVDGGGPEDTVSSAAANLRTVELHTNNCTLPINLSFVLPFTT